MEPLCTCPCSNACQHSSQGDHTNTRHHTSIKLGSTRDQERSPRESHMPDHVSSRPVSLPSTARSCNWSRVTAHSHACSCASAPHLPISAPWGISDSSAARCKAPYAVRRDHQQQLNLNCHVPSPCENPGRPDPPSCKTLMHTQPTTNQQSRPHMYNSWRPAFSCLGREGGGVIIIFGDTQRPASQHKAQENAACKTAE